MAGLYIHIPFCKSKCGYCDFYSISDLVHTVPLLEALKNEMERERGFFGEEPLRTIYIGGGTPSVYAPAQLQSLINKAAEIWGAGALEEVTVEVNPDDLSSHYLKGLAATAVDRLSIGIQSFDDRDLLFMNRRHTGEVARAAVREARKTGFRNISADLIYGIPGATAAGLRKNIDSLLSLGVEHISAYHLTIEEATPFGRLAAANRLAPVDEAVSEEQYLLLHHRLTEAGYEHYEISNFALPGYKARHNRSYWKGTPYLGVGPSAHSFDGTIRRSSPCNVEQYLNARNGVPYRTETLTAGERRNEYVMTALRCAEGVDIGLMEERFGRVAAEKFAARAEKFLRQGVMRRQEGRFFILPEKFLLSDSVICDLFDE